MADIDQVERFQGAVIAEVMLESPECAERILRRLDRLASDYEF
jgi:hypothetical protein